MSSAEQYREAQVSAVAALDEPTRRRLYDHVTREQNPVSRDEAATALDLPRTTAAFHLDKLAAEGLLDVIHERRSGRTGPGAGRPAKLYRRAQCDVAVSLPQRRYDLAGQLLAAAIAASERSGDSPRAVLDRHAYRWGRELAEAARLAGDDEETRDAALRILETHGYEPRPEGSEIVLGNCPFHALAQEHTELVCGMNLRLLDGLLQGLPPAGLTAVLQPAPHHCCVRLTSDR